VTVRQAVSSDVAGMVDLLEAVVAEGRWLGRQGPLDRAEQVERLSKEVGGPGPTTHLVADVDGAVVGHLGLALAPYGVAELGMAVLAPWRGRGIGSALVSAAIERARDLGAHKLSLQLWPHNVAARALYAKHGFVEEGVLRRHYRRRNGELWDAVVMGLVLDDESPGGPGGGHGAA
jgi:RimJ/RimL family protein N-acetyltransferase